jgi:hypothetical protein
VEPGIGVTNADNTTAVAAAMAAVEWSDITVLALGLEHSLEHEGMDRQNTFLPASQVAFALQVLASGKPVVLVLVSRLQAHKLIQIYTNTDYCLVAFCTWIPSTR